MNRLLELGHMQKSHPTPTRTVYVLSFDETENMRVDLIFTGIMHGDEKMLRLVIEKDGVEYTNANYEVTIFRRDGRCETMCWAEDKAYMLSKSDNAMIWAVVEACRAYDERTAVQSDELLHRDVTDILSTVFIGHEREINEWFINAIMQDVHECSDYPNYTSSDIHIAIIRVILWMMHKQE